MNTKLKADQGHVIFKGFYNACQFLGLTQIDSAKVLGVSDSTFKRAKKSASITPSSNEAQLALHFIRLYRALYAVAGGDQSFMRHWFTTENKTLNGKPNELVETMIGLFSVNQYLDALRGKI